MLKVFWTYAMHDFIEYRRQSSHMGNGEHGIEKFPLVTMMLSCTRQSSI